MKELKMKCPNCGNETDSSKDLCLYCGNRLIPGGTPQALPQDPQLYKPGTVLRGRYQITKEAPKAHGQAIVYFATDITVENKACVVKQIREEVISDTVLDKLKGEVKRQTELGQTIGGRVPEILDNFVENRRFHLVQQRVPGKTLENIYDEKHPLSEAEVVNWGIQSCRILQLIHDHKILHRDISPDNLMLTPNGDIVFIDFGTLRELRRIAQGTQGIGKLGFAPLEQWNLHPVIESDLFAMGATIFYLLTGWRPPISDEVKRGKDPIQSDKQPVYPPIRKINSKISNELEKILVRALKLSVSERYHSADEMRTDLEKLVGTGNPPLVNCPKCGHMNDASYIYCEKCQEQLYPGTRPCPKNPKHQVPINAKYCPKDGAKMP
jgi:serine/threonine protein kinase